MQVTGTVVVRLNGASIRSESGAQLSMGGFERAPRFADHGLLGFSKKPVESTITCTLAHTAQTDLQAINETENATLIFETDTGVTYTVRNAWCSKPPELTGGEGQVAVEFKGSPAI